MRNSRRGRQPALVSSAASSVSAPLLSPVIAVVTNIDNDHMETYGHDFARLKQAFIEFLGRLPFYGTAVLCSDDRNVREILPRLVRLTEAVGEHAMETEPALSPYVIGFAEDDPCTLLLDHPALMQALHERLCGRA